MNNAWTQYWTTEARSEGGCCGDGEIAEVLDEVWAEFAETLPPRARVLDLATGDGAVLRRIRARRPKAELVGVDLAEALPRPGRNIRLMPGVAMEDLPFEAGRFDAVTAQFGLEYGDIERAIREVSRVLVPGGRARGLGHHRDSPMIAHNVARRHALAWAVLESGWLDKARSFARARALANLPVPPTFRTAVDEASRLHPGQPVAAEFIAAILQSLQLHAHAPVERTLQALDRLAQKARHEMGRIELLERAALDDDQVATCTDWLDQAEMRVDQVRMLTEPSQSRPFAWMIDATRVEDKAGAPEAS